MPRLVHHSDVENVFDTPERAARLAGRIRELDGPDALVVGSGDTTAPGVLSLVASGRQAVDFHVATDTALETFGNHEFDHGPGALRELLERSPATYVSANVRDEDGERFGAAEGVVPHAVREIDGSRVGFVGVTDPATDSLNPMAASLSFSDPIAAVEAELEAMRAAADPPDHLVVLSHLGGGDDDLARALDVDAILGGHVHSPRNEHVDGTLLVRPGVNGAAVAEVELFADRRPTATLRERSDADPHSDLRNALERRMANTGLDETVATLDEPMSRTDEVVHGGECRVGNFVADAFRWALSADVGLTNAGGLRSGDPIAGRVTRADLVSLIPFEEPVVRAEVTGRELRSILAEMAAPTVDFGEDDWWHGHVSNARVVWDADAETLRDATVDGRAIDPEATYTVATSEYLLHSDQEFPTLRERHRAGEGGIQYEVLWRYAAERGIDPTIDGRIRVLNGSNEEADAERPAEEPSTVSDRGPRL
ncbi:bifunctional metallophosphatase/5'-nucleotidase [Halopenitus salinus]|uniref:Bifunctional metallophosphatase/5'-nucleotidase n=1 Tax=Halopenitus salinus TaxID=1198295 RepID=A0ABD5UUN7_9EURY